jgi:PAS domain S-box-containing protein
MVKKRSTGSEYRIIAESKLREKSLKKRPDVPDTDPVKLLHELQVHQVELELQNEELTQQRDRAEEAIRKFSDLYTEIYDFTPVPYFSFSSEGIILASNLKASEMLGSKRSTLINKNFRRFLPPSMHGLFDEFLIQVFSKPGKARVEIQILKPDHSIMHCIIEGTLSDNESKCLAMLLDINELKNLESELRETQRGLEESNRLAQERLIELENIYRNVPAGLCVLDTDLKFLRINERLAEFNGMPAKDHIGKNVKDILPQLYETARAITNRILETGEPQSGMEFIIADPDRPDDVRSWSEDWSPIRDNTGRIIGINVAAVETTSEKRVKEELLKKEQKLIAAKEALEQSQKKLNITLENARIGTWEWDLRSNKITFDKRTEEIFGLKPGTFEGTLSAFENLIHEDDLEFVRAAVDKAFHGKPEQTVYRTRPVNGRFAYVSASSVFIRDRQGNPKIIAGVCFDITNLKSGIDQTLQRMNEELTRSNNDLQQFAYVASHDLQEPLRMVSSFVQLLQNRYSNMLDQDAKEYIQYAVDGARRMYELLNGLLAYSRVQTREHEFSRTDLNEVLVKVKANLSLVVSDSNAEISSDRLPVVLADENQIIQVLQNLIENGIKFSQGKPKISIRSMEDDNDHIIKVSDKGIGIEPQYHERIFRIFQRLHGASEYRGTGIGLAVCKRIIERHGGKIWVESNAGHGSTFCFTLPKKSSQHDHKNRLQ